MEIDKERNEQYSRIWVNPTEQEYHAGINYYGRHSKSQFVLSSAATAAHDVIKWTCDVI